MSNEMKFQFTLKDIMAPELVAKKVFADVEEATRGYVSVAVEGYKKPISNQTTKSLSKTLASALTDNISNLQDSLGEINAEKHIYEVSVKTKVMESYKYRMLFLKYDTMSYPVEAVIDNELAENVFRQSKTYVTNQDMDALEELLQTIKNSAFFNRLVQNLINESLRRETT